VDVSPRLFCGWASRPPELGSLAFVAMLWRYQPLPISRPLASSRQRRLLYCPRPARRGTWPALRVFAPTLDLPPTQRGERNGTGLMVAPDRQQVWAARTVSSRRIIVYAAAAHV
jgi:hypothetical protein